MQVKLLIPTAEIPKRRTEGAAGFDLHSTIHTWLHPGKRKAIPTGVAFSIDPHWVGNIRPRSGLAVHHGIDVLAGVIDSDYRGEIQVVLVNHGDISFEIAQGDRIAQIVFSPVWTHDLLPVETLDATARGDGRYGSTGMK